MQGSTLLASPRELRGEIYKYGFRKGRYQLHIKDGILCGSTYGHPTCLCYSYADKPTQKHKPYLKKSAIRSIMLRKFASMRMLYDNAWMQLKAADFECLAGLTGLEEVEILDYASNRKCCMPKWVNVISRIGFEWSPYVKASAQELRPVRARGGRMVPLFFSRRGRPMV
ncbi:hypothetical protein HBH64_160550 [Parastagonospora nodorum]|nr:hypothetical protein HBI02_034330 [Parastagonospora nodorum]KAH4326548.1 hypothetical protein HBI00_138240 [Parastagonospora nodorum]KAH4388402.1 hypothetical protein HBH94_034210 [Parastagonospora nodorum]KAH4476043.1 hypothetical protein HBH90_018580 [Parastagonospora nodorum]KAH4509143.1 hypothetical protein HBH88_042590 [Parastagonospora nodorum]